MSLTTKVVGVDVSNASNRDIGAVADVAFDGNQINAQILPQASFLATTLPSFAADLSFNTSGVKIRNRTLPSQGCELRRFARDRSVDR